MTFLRVQKPLEWLYDVHGLSCVFVCCAFSPGHWTGAGWASVAVRTARWVFSAHIRTSILLGAWRPPPPIRALGHLSAPPGRLSVRTGTRRPALGGVAVLEFRSGRTVRSASPRLTLSFRARLVALGGLPMAPVLLILLAPPLVFARFWRSATFFTDGGGGRGGAATQTDSGLRRTWWERVAGPFAPWLTWASGCGCKARSWAGLLLGLLAALFARSVPVFTDLLAAASLCRLRRLPDPMRVFGFLPGALVFMSPVLFRKPLPRFTVVRAV